MYAKTLIDFKHEKCDREEENKMRDSYNKGGGNRCKSKEQQPQHL